MRDQMPPDEMKAMAAVALEQAFQTVAEHALQFAASVPPDMSGRDAMLAFAQSILSTNARTFKAPKVSQ